METQVLRRVLLRQDLTLNVVDLPVFKKKVGEMTPVALALAGAMDEVTINYHVGSGQSNIPFLENQYLSAY